MTLPPYSPPEAPRPNRPNRTLLVPLVLVLLVAAVIATVLTRGADPSAGEEFADPQGTYRMDVDPAWTPNHGVLTAEIEVWFVGESSDDFAPNVTVLTQAAADLDLRGYLDLSVEQAPDLVEGFTAVDEEIVQGPTGQELAILEYTGTQEGRDLHFLAVCFLEDDQAVVATYVSMDEQFPAQRPDVEPFLRTLRPA
jgi:hypothetical protein